jgi:phage terminase large subunit
MELTIRTPRVFKPLLQPARYKGAYGGRGSAKSNFFAELAIESCFIKNTFGVCAREVQKSLKQSVKRLLENKINDLGVQDFFEIQDTCIKGPNNSEIIFLGLQSHTSDAIKSLEGADWLWLEEAQNISQKSLDIARPTLRKPGSEIWASWNPNEATDPIDALLRGPVPPPNSIVVQANYMDNPWFPEELKIELEYDKRRDYDKYLHVWMGEYLSNSEARVFRNWKVEEFEAPNGTVFRLGADWGFAVDPSVLIRCYIEGNILYIDYEAYKVGCEIVNLPDLFMQVPEAEKWPIIADSARPETISHMRQNGFPRIRSAIKGAKSIEDGVEFLKSYDIVVHPRCKHVITELELYSYKIDPLTDKVLPVLSDKHNHCIDAIRYGLEGARRAKAAKVIDYQYKPKELSSVGWMGR